jgi:4-hydroxy-2-oxoheptanedioate aldolase
MGGRYAVRLTEGDDCHFGTWVKLPTLETVEMLAYAGFDFVVVDMEHSPMTFESAYGAVVLAQSLGLGALVRVPDRSESHLQRLLDCGVDGILLPRITDVEQCRELIGGTRFSPTGTRGMGITSRAGRWGQISSDEYRRRGEQEVLRVIQLEDRDSLADAERFLAIEGVNGVFIGRGDLTLSSGRPATHPDNDVVVAHALAACIEAGIPCSTAVAGAEAARACRDRGYRFVMVSNDATMFGRAATGLRKAIG